MPNSNCNSNTQLLGSTPINPSLGTTVTGAIETLSSKRKLTYEALPYSTWDKSWTCDKTGYYLVGAQSSGYNSSTTAWSRFWVNSTEILTGLDIAYSANSTCVLHLNIGDKLRIRIEGNDPRGPYAFMFVIELGDSNQWDVGTMSFN